MNLYVISSSLTDLFFSADYALEYGMEIHMQIDQMKYYGGWSFVEAYSLPVGLRNWYYTQLVDRKKEEAKAQEEASGSSRVTLGE